MTGRALHGAPRAIPACGLRRRGRWLATALAASLLMACGGGIDLAGGVGSGGSGLAEGTITGFASVIVDGVRYDDSAAQARVRGEDDQLTAAALHLGQRVRLDLDDTGKARAIEVLPQLRGPVTQARAGDVVRVAGQWVRVDADTVFADEVAQTALGAGGAEVEVHGQWVQDDTRGTVLAATLVLAVAAVPADAPVLVGGVVQAVDGRTVTLGLAGGTRLSIPQAQPLPAVGDVLTGWVSRDAMTGVDHWPVRRQRQPPVVDDGVTLVVGGAVRASEGGRVRVQGLDLTWPDGSGAVGALALPPQRGDFVQLTLRRVAGNWQVQGVARRDAPEKLGGRVELRARLSGIDWSAQPLVLTLRGVRVAVPAGVLADYTCADFGAAPVDVEVEAARGVLPVRALALKCVAPVLPGSGS